MKKNMLLCAAIFLSLVLAAVVIWAMVQHYDLTLLFIAIVDQIFVSHFGNYNLYFSGMIESVNVMAAFELLILLALVLTLIGLILVRAKRPAWRLDALSCLCACWIAALLLFNFLQEIKRIAVFGSAVRNFSGMDVDERLNQLFGPSYAFAQQCGQKLKKPLNVEFLTDANMETDPYISQQRRLAYYFYPQVSLRFQRPGPVDGKFYFYKNDFPAALAPDFAVVCANEQNTFVLAIKKDKVSDYVGP